MHQAAKGTQDVNSNIESVSKAAEETGMAADKVLNSTQSLTVQAETLRNEVENFLHEVRAG